MSELTIEDKLAMLYRHLPTEIGERLLQQLAPELRERARRKLVLDPAPGSEDPHVIEGLFEELSSLLDQSLESPGESSVSTASEEDVTHLLFPAAAVASRYEERASEPVRKAPSAWKVLRSLDPELLALALEDEQPRTIALILNVLAAPEAAEILQHLPSGPRCQASLLLTEGVSVHPRILQPIAEAMVSKCHDLANGNLKMGKQARLRRMAEMIVRLEQAEQSEILTALEQRDPSAAEEVRQWLRRSAA